MAEWTLYCDESGNTGPDYLNLQQPFHVAAGWLVHASKIDLINEACKALDGVNVAIKGTDLLKSSPGRTRILALFARIAEAPALPFFMVFERNVALAARVLDFFCDPDSNPSAAWLPMHAKERRKAIAEVLATKLDTSVLVAFAHAYRAADVALAAAFLDKLQSAPILNELPQLRMTFEGAARNLEQLLEREKVQIDDRDHKLWTALNLPAYNHMIVRADRYLDKKGRMTIVHDNIEGFIDILRLSTETMLPGAIEMATEFGKPMRLGLRNVDGFSPGKALEYPALRAADCLASSVARIFRDLSSHEKWTGQMRELARFILPLVYGADPVHGVADVSSLTNEHYVRHYSYLFGP